MSYQRPLEKRIIEKRYNKTTFRFISEVKFKKGGNWSEIEAIKNQIENLILDINFSDSGSYVTDGIVKKDAKARLIRDGIVIVDTKISTLQREKDQAKEVKKGYECGLTLENYSDIKVGDTLEVYETIEVKR